MHTQITSIHEKEKSTFSKSKIFFFLIVALLFVAAAYYSTTIKQDIKLFEKENNLWLLAAIAGQLCTYLLGAVVYHRLLGMFHAGNILSIWELFQTTIVTLFLNQTIPSAGISGNTYIFHSLTRRNLPSSQVLSLIIIELLTFYASIELIISLVFSMSLTFFHLPASMLILLAAGFVVYLIFSIAIAFIDKKKPFINTLYQKLTTVPLLNRLAGKLERSFATEGSLKKTASPLQLLQNHKRTLTITILYQTCIFLADAFTIFALFEGLSTPISFFQVTVGYILTRIVSLLPLAPGALILYESSMTFFYVSLGVPLSAAIIVTLLYRVLSFWLPMPFGFFIFRKFQAKEAHHNI